MRRSKIKTNIWNEDVLDNKGYKYTTNPPYSALVAHQRLTDEMLKILARHKLKTLVEVGCGDGVYTKEIKKKFKKLKISAFDPAAKAIELAKKQYLGIDFFVANIYSRKSLPKKKFDIALIRSTLHHLDRPALAIKNTLTLADSILIIDPNGNNPLVKLFEKKSKYHIEHEEKSYSISEFEQFCHHAGCQIEKTTYVGFVPTFFPTIPAKIIHFFQPFLELIPVLNKYLSAQVVLVIRNNRGSNVGD